MAAANVSTPRSTDKNCRVDRKKEELSVKNYCFVWDFYVFFSGRFVNNTLRGKSADGTRVCVRTCRRACGVNNRFHEIGVTLGITLHARQNVMHGRYLEVDAPSVGRNLGVSNNRKGSKRSEIREAAGRFNSAIWTNFCADTRRTLYSPHFLPFVFSTRKRKREERDEIEWE